MSDNWRIRIQPHEAKHGETLLERLGLDLGSDEAKRLAEELQGHRLAVSRDDDTIFVYAETQPQAEQARAASSRPSSPRRASRPRSRSSAGSPTRSAGRASRRRRPGSRRSSPATTRPGRCGSSCHSHDEAEQLADQLEREGYDVVRRWRYLIVGTASEEHANALAQRVHGEAEPGGQVVWEVTPQNPFAVFGGLGG